MKKTLKKSFFIFLLILTSFSAGFSMNDFLRFWDYKNNINGLVNIDNEEINKDNGIGYFWNIIDQKNDKIENKADFSIFWEAWSVIENKYNLEPLDYQKMVYGAVSGMVDSLNDPYTVFFVPEDRAVFEQDMKGSFSGIGAEIGFRNKFLTVIAPLKDSPAEKAGILPGDKILKVDGTEIMGLSLDEAVSIVRGEKGSEVKLIINREGSDDLKEIYVIRDIIKINTVEWETLENNIAYIRISQFMDETTSEFDSKINSILVSDPSGIIIDLRNNPGGYVSTLEDIASKFLDKGEVIFIEDFGEKKEIYKAKGNRKFENIPIVILINEGSASASEIFAGALRDNDGVKLVGKTTFGKGLVQEMQNLRDGSAIKVTIARWLTPNGIDINKNGINPDFEVELSLDDWENNRDPQLEKAIEILSSK
ncbi:MAG: S41 family peptidase [Patescibacteria group bacterium]|nr:S41 family peptidase [Patescibacteria group bacterium]